MERGIGPSKGKWQWEGVGEGNKPKEIREGEKRLAFTHSEHWQREQLLAWTKPRGLKPVTGCHLYWSPLYLKGEKIYLGSLLSFIQREGMVAHITSQWTNQNIESLKPGPGYTC